MTQPRKRAPGAGRKKLMDTNNFTGWLNNLLIEHLNSFNDKGFEYSHKRVKTFVNHSNILISLVDVQSTFGVPALNELRRFFFVATGNQDTGFSVLTIRNGDQLFLLRYLETQGLANKLDDDFFGFKAGAVGLREARIYNHLGLAPANGKRLAPSQMSEVVQKHLVDWSDEKVQELYDTISSIDHEQRIQDREESREVARQLLKESKE